MQIVSLRVQNVRKHVHNAPEKELNTIVLDMREKHGNQCSHSGGDFGCLPPPYKKRSKLSGVRMRAWYQQNPLYIDNLTIGGRCV